MMTVTTSNEPDTPEVEPNKRRRKKSIVWEHFTVEDVGSGCTRACCKQCKQTFAYSTGTKLSGTSHLKRHIGLGICLASRRKEKNQLRSSSTGSAGTGNVTYPPRRQSNGSYWSVNAPFDQELCRHEIAKMIIMHDYPLHMVGHPAFISFVKSLQPTFNLVDCDTVQGDCMAIYHKEKQELSAILSGISGRISLSVDLWTSSETLVYVILTGHFINSGWKLHRRILSVVMVPFPHSEDALNHAVGICLSDWGLENKLFSLTFNKSIFGNNTGSLRAYLSVKNPLTLKSQLLIEHCYAQVLSSIAQDALGLMEGTVSKVRESIKYVKTSRTREEKFLELKHKLQVPSTKCLFLDDQTEWNTTYLMLVASTELKEVFSCLDTADLEYKLTLTMDDWKQIETLCMYLKFLYDAANVLTSTRHPTADLFFHEVWKIQLELICGATSQDPLIFNLTNTLREKFDTYWKDCSLILAIAVVLNPQFKMKIVDFSFSKIYGDEANSYLKMVDEGIHELFSEYIVQFLPLTSFLEEASINNIKIEEAFELSSDGTVPSNDHFFDSDIFIAELSSSDQTRSELDQYLEEPVVPFTEDFDILSWWNLNSFKFPSLSKMACDILSTPVSAVAPESLFSTSGRVLNPNWSSLQPETVQALVCSKDWLQYGSVERETQSSLVKMEISIL